MGLEISQVELFSTTLLPLTEENLMQQQQWLHKKQKALHPTMNDLDNYQMSNLHMQHAEIIYSATTDSPNSLHPTPYHPESFSLPKSSATSQTELIEPDFIATPRRACSTIHVKRKDSGFSVVGLKPQSKSFRHRKSSPPPHPMPCLDSESNKRCPWLKRVLKVFSKQKTPSYLHTEGNYPVWYCKYSENPETRFEEYYSR